jgi:hypothetical protein
MNLTRHYAYSVGCEGDWLCRLIEILIGSYTLGTKCTKNPKLFFMKAKTPTVLVQLSSDIKNPNRVHPCRIGVMQ